MARCLLALGSNLGDRHSWMSQACAQIAQLPDSHLLARSRWHGTFPIGGAAGQGEFLNGVNLVETALPPAELAVQLRQIENQLGRQRAVRWDARTIDIDVLLYDVEVVETEALILPHPRMSFRRFVLEPAAEIAGWMTHPTSGWTISRLLVHLQQSPRFLVVTSGDAEIADRLVSRLKDRWNCSVWSGAEQILAAACGSPDTSRVEFPQRAGAGPPVIAQLSPETLDRFAAVLLAGGEWLPPAFVIAVETVGDHRPLGIGPRSGADCLGPVARITASDPAIIAQEAEAAVCCVWPELSGE